MSVRRSARPGYLLSFSRSFLQQANQLQTFGKGGKQGRQLGFGLRNEIFFNGRSHVVRASRSDGSLCSRTFSGPKNNIISSPFSFFFPFFPSFLFSFLLSSFQFPSFFQ